MRAIVLGCLLPATDEAAADLDVFLKLMAMDDAAFGRRFDKSAAEFARLFPDYGDLATVKHRKIRVWRRDISKAVLEGHIADALATLPYPQRIQIVRRPEECDETELLLPVWGRVNHHLGTTASSLAGLVEQLGVARYGHRPRVADTFCGGGSIPFEAARVGCDVYASDLNPIACMLTWGAFNIIGASREARAEIRTAQKEIVAAVEAAIALLGVEHDAEGNRAKAFLYCLETRCPKTGWMVPMASSWVISKQRNVVAKLVPDFEAKRYNIEIETGVSASEMAEAELGTVRGGRLVHPNNTERSGVDLKTVRGDFRGDDGDNCNRLRRWGKEDFTPQPEDIFQERLYCIQWITKETFGLGRQETFFATVTADDLARERKVIEIVRNNLDRWQRDGLVPDDAILAGEKTEEPIRTRGWVYWHQLFSPRDILFFSILRPTATYLHSIIFAKLADRTTKLCGWVTTNNREAPNNVFADQALTPQTDYCVYSSSELLRLSSDVNRGEGGVTNSAKTETMSASDVTYQPDMFVTDPPYADAIVYHEITEFFIAWLRKNPPPPFDQWSWDSHRDLAIKGKDEQFRRDMVAAYGAMTRHMPDNGLQVVMFTHQDAGVWADLGAILWAAGLARHRRLERRHRDRERAEGGQLRPGHCLPRAAQAHRRSQRPAHGDRGRDRGGRRGAARPPNRARRLLARAQQRGVALYRRRPDACGLRRRTPGRHRLLVDRPPAARPRSLSQARQGRDGRCCAT